MNRRHLYGATFGIIGVLLASVQLIHATEQTDVPIAIAVDGVPFALLGLSLSFAGYWLASNNEFKGHLPRIAAWAVGGTLLLASVAALTLFSQRVATGTLQRATYTTADSITVGAVAGTVVGLYDAQSQQHLRKLEAERDRTEEFARKAADLNNYGRALAQATTVEEVSAYCIEGLSSLLSLSETAFVEVGPEDASITSSTVSNGFESQLRSVARQAAEDETIVAVHEDGHLGEDVASVLTVQLENTAATTGVLVAIRETTEPISTEDEQLLELLSSHASMVLNRIYSDPGQDLLDNR
jgi:K+-sensing histidine kinase KdpD